MRKLRIAVLATLADRLRRPRLLQRVPRSGPPVCGSSRVFGSKRRDPVPPPTFRELYPVVGISRTRPWYLGVVRDGCPGRQLRTVARVEGRDPPLGQFRQLGLGDLETAIRGTPARIVIDVGVGVEGLSNVNGCRSSIRDTVQMARTVPGARRSTSSDRRSPGCRIARSSIRVRLRRERFVRRAVRRPGHRPGDRRGSPTIFRPDLQVSIMPTCCSGSARTPDDHVRRSEPGQVSWGA